MESSSEQEEQEKQKELVRVDSKDVLKVVFQFLSEQNLYKTAKTLLQETDVDVDFGEECRADKLDAHLLMTCIYLGPEERDHFANQAFDMHITQVQASQSTHTTKMIQEQLYFNLSAKYIMIALRSHENERYNNWFNFSCYGQDTLSIHTHHGIKFNNQVRVADTAVALRTVYPFMCAAKIPACFTYLMPFSLLTHSDEPMSTGTANLSRIDNTVINLTLSDCAVGQTWSMFIYCESYNILQFAQGILGARYAA